jgi:hypothetical protein
MTTTTLAAAGSLGLTAARGYLFGPLGAAAGALVGSFLFGGSGQKVEGPRLGDLSVAASSYGGVIPVGFGTQKVAGSIIWATDIRETKHTDTKGGSIFGGGTKVVEVACVEGLDVRGHFLLSRFDPSGRKVESSRPGTEGVPTVGFHGPNGRTRPIS